MAERRMFAKTIIDSDAFLEQPITSQLLYFHLSMRADDDGFVNKPRAIMNMIGAKNEDMQILIKNKFIILFDSGVIVIKHWKIHNYIRKDAYTETKYKFEKAHLYLDENNAWSENPQPCDDTVTLPSQRCDGDVTGLSTQVRIGNSKDSTDKVSTEFTTANSGGKDDIPTSANEESDWENRRKTAIEHMERLKIGGYGG